MLKSFILASAALLSLKACTDTVQDKDVESYPEPYVPERSDDGPS